MAPPSETPPRRTRQPINKVLHFAKNLSACFSVQGADDLLPFRKLSQMILRFQTSDKLTGCGAIRYGVCGTAIHAAHPTRLKPEVIDVLLSLGAHFSCLETSLFVS
jgi:hypothetical protein